MAPKKKNKPLLDLEKELQGDSDSEDARPRRPQPSAAGARGAAAQAASPAAARKREKEFAWMDSDDEDKGDALGSGAAANIDDPAGLFSGEGAPGAGRRASASRSRSRSPSGPQLPDSVADVHSFSQMVRMVDDLKRRVRTMEPTELIQCVSAAARVKFYDRTFLQDLLMPHIRSHLRNKKRVPFTTDELLTTLCSLSDLNCFDQVIFDGIVRELANKRSKELGCPQWAALLAAFKKVNYTCDEDKEFYEWMRVSLKAERYEIASAEQRMIVGNSKQGMHAPEGYLRSFMVGTMNNGVEVRRPQGLTS